MIRSTISSVILIGLLLSIAVLPAGAQDATPVVDIGKIDDTTVEADFERMTFVGMMVFSAKASEVDGSVDNPVDLLAAAALEMFPTLKDASAPEYGDESRLMVGTVSGDGVSAEMAMLWVQDGNRVFLMLGAGLTLVLDEFLPLVDTLMTSDYDNLEEWLPTVDDMPAGFTESEDHG